MMSLRIRFGILASALFFSSVVHAQSANDEKARVLFDAGIAAYDRGGYEEATTNLEAALKLKPDHLGTAISLARCHNKLGKPGTAWNLLVAARIKAAARLDQKKLGEIDELMADLKDRVARIRLDIPAPIKAVSDLAIFRDEVPIPQDQWESPIVVDPGTLRIKASATNKETWVSKEYNVPKNEVVTVAVTPDWSPPSSGQRTAGFVGIGIGSGALIAGGILGGLALSKNADSSANGHCDTTSACDEVGTSLRLEAQKLGNVSTGLLIGGGVVALTGVILVAVAPKPTPTQSGGPQVSLWLGAGSVGVRGRW